jgi:cytochrome c-type biogenesis protein CcmH/NrfG
LFQENIVLHRLTLVACLTVVGLLGSISGSIAQALVPHTVLPSNTQLEQTGIALLREAVQLTQFQQYEPALARARLAVQLVPNIEESWALLGGLYLSTNQIDPGIKALERAIAINPKNAGAQFSIGSAYFRKGNYEGAIKAIELGLQIKPDVLEAMFDLGNAHFRMGSYKAAIAAYRKAFTKDQTFWPAINNIGLVNYEQGDVDEAIKNWKTAAVLDGKPKTPDGQQGAKSGEPEMALAIALYKQGDKAQAFQLAESALSVNSRYSDVEFLKENLWGDRLIADTKVVLATPEMKKTLARLVPPEPKKDAGTTQAAPKPSGNTPQSTPKPATPKQ